jgi:hypothetical protein
MFYINQFLNFIINAQILRFVLKHDHDFKSNPSILTFKTLVSCIINYNFVLNSINIALHLHVIKDSWIVNRPSILKNTKFNFLKFWVFFKCV